MRYFATAIPGLHPVLAREIEALRGARAAPLREFDGRNDVVSFTARGSGGLIGLRTAEDAFAEVSSVHGQERLGRSSAACGTSKASNGPCRPTPVSTRCAPG